MTFPLGEGVDWGQILRFGREIIEDMKMKDVEKLTGLTAKSIRFYEAKGLLKVGRNEENSYREYTEENIAQLRRIKLFRYLDFSIEELQGLDDWKPEKVTEALTKKAESYTEQMESCESKRDICLSLCKDYSKNSCEVVEEYDNLVDYMEGDEFRELQQELDHINCPTLWTTIVFSLVMLGPILCLFINIQRQMLAALPLNSALALGATVMLTLSWRKFLYYRKYSKEKVKEKNLQTRFVIPIMILAIIITLMAFVGITVLQEKVFLPEDWLFCEMDPRLMVLFIVTLMIPILMVLAQGANYLDRSGKWDSGKYAFDWAYELCRHKRIVLVLWFLCFYVCFTSITYVTPNEIVRHTPLNPVGTKYAYHEVEKIEARFGNKSISFFDYKRKGNFSYTIWLDGKKTIFLGGSSNDKISRYEDTYLETEEFDQALVKLGIPKEGDATYHTHCDMDKRYVDRLVRVVENGRKTSE